MLALFYRFTRCQEINCVCTILICNHIIRVNCIIHGSDIPVSIVHAKRKESLFIKVQVGFIYRSRASVSFVITTPFFDSVAKELKESKLKDIALKSITPAIIFLTPIFALCLTVIGI